jgi:tetratricopeptide (TPR) repeat protein
MKKQNVVSVIALSLALVMGAVGTATVLFNPHRAEAAQNSVSPAVGNPLQEARKLAEAKNFSEAIAKAKEADAVAKKSDYETYMISEILGSIYLQARQYANAAATLERSIATGQLAPEDATNRIKLLSQVYYQVKNYRKAVQYGRQFLQSAGNDIPTMVIVGQSQFLLKQFKQASASMRGVIRAAQRSRTKISETWLQLLMTSEYNLKNDSGVRDALEQLLRLYPNDRYWTDYVGHIEKDLRGASTKTALDLLRFRLASGAMKGAKDYTDMAELSLQEGLPGDAQRALETGITAGVIGKGDQAGRHERLMNMAVERATEDKAGLAAGDAEAAALATGDADVSFGEAYWTYGEYAASVVAVERGISKGVQNMDGALLRLGLAHLGAGDKAKAAAAFKKITAGSPEAAIAKLWTLKGSI